MDFTNPVLNADRPDPHGRASGPPVPRSRDLVRGAAAPLGSPAGHEHVTFGAALVDLVGAEEVAA